MLQPETDKFKLFPLAQPRLTVSLFEATIRDIERGGFLEKIVRPRLETELL